MEQQVLLHGMQPAVLVFFQPVINSNGVAKITSKPSRSVVAYCKVYGQEKGRLSALSNQSNPYPSGLFNVSVSDAGQITISLKRLNRVAPKQIELEVSGLQKVYEDIQNNPPHAINDSLNGGSLDDSLKSWTQQHCQA
jgi:hypothetical protein